MSIVIFPMIVFILVPSPVLCVKCVFCSLIGIVRFLLFLSDFVRSAVSFILHILSYINLFVISSIIAAFIFLYDIGYEFPTNSSIIFIIIFISFIAFFDLLIYTFVFGVLEVYFFPYNKFLLLF